MSRIYEHYSEDALKNLMECRDDEIGSLIAKLQAAEELNKELVDINKATTAKLTSAEQTNRELERVHSTWDDWFRHGVDKTNEAISRAEAAEAEANALSDTADRMEQERDKALAEVARLKLERDQWEETYYRAMDDETVLRARISDLKEGLRHFIAADFYGDKSDLLSANQIATRLLGAEGK